MIDDAEHQLQQAFERAAELFGLLATPIRLRIISELCQGERNGSQLLDHITVTQSNMSQHLNTLYRAGVVSRRRHGAQVFYRLSEGVAPLLCSAICTQLTVGSAGRLVARPLALTPGKSPMTSTEHQQERE
jgi:DNA-binding transcriptional ArsR family regulator